MGLIWTAVLKFVANHWLSFLLVGAVGVAYVDGGYQQMKKSNVTISQLRARDKMRDDEITKERKDWTDRIASLEDQANKEAEAISAQHKIDLAQADADLGDALDRLHKRESAKPAPAKPAAAAPLICAEYQAAPNLLPIVDRQLLVKLAAAADRVVLERNACIAQYELVRQKFVTFNADHLNPEVLAEVF